MLYGERNDAVKKIQDELDEEKSQNAKIRTKYNIMSKYADDQVKQIEKMSAEYKTLEDHFTIIANGFNSLNILIAQQASK